MKLSFSGVLLMLGLLAQPALFAIEPAQSTNELRSKLASLSDTERSNELLDAASTLADETKTTLERVSAVRRLGLLQDSASIPVLRLYLNDMHLGEEARIAMQYNPSPVVAVAFLDELKRMSDPKLKAGLIGSLGTMRIESVIPFAMKETNNDDPSLAEASLRALARIKTAKSLESLNSAKINPIHKKLVLDLLLNTCAWLITSPENADAWNQVKTTLEKLSNESDYPGIQFSATLMRIQYGHLAVEDCITGKGAILRDASIEFLRRSRDIESGKFLLDFFPKAQSSDAVKVIAALSERGMTEVLPQIRARIANDNDDYVKIEAIHALGLMGSSSDVYLLATLAFSSNEDIAAAARAALYVINGAGTGETFSGIIASDSYDEQTRKLFIAIATRRPLREVIPGLIETLSDDNATLRTEAMKSLSRLIGPKNLLNLEKARTSITDEETRQSIDQLFQKLTAEIKK
ncbi:MAG: HEAT repeat domain-containing protein [Puniceicoccales bacterium]|jgi:HEAT repeat protein|nr:HEAT repeat domain-containing protein [Puniceicoccales bacterium]